ncbi:hypothetical protein VC33_15750 [Pseudomonas fluorescens]|nr:hypothetical protein VC33_15750 [Pseudomonas fluorescens]
MTCGTLRDDCIHGQYSLLLLLDGFLHFMLLQRYGLTIAQGPGSAQHADLVHSIQSVCHQRRPDCGD